MVALLPDRSKLTLGPGEISEDKLSHLLPNEFGTLSQPLTNGETLGLNWISANYLKKSAHPQWMIESLKSGVPPAQTIIEALGLHMRQHDADAMLEKLRLMKYSGDIRAFAYVAQVKQIIEPLLGISNPALESIIKKTILRNLTGPYKTLADRFRTRLSSYPIQEIFDRLLAQYAATETQSTSSASKHSSQRTQKRKRTCTNCNSSNHTADRCPKLTPSTSKSTSPSTSSYRPRNSAHKPSNRNKSVQHANNVNSVVPDLNEEIARHLRRAPLPSPTNKFFMIDTGCHTSIVNDENFLHNKRSPDNVWSIAPSSDMSRWTPPSILRWQDHLYSRLLCTHKRVQPPIHNGYGSSGRLLLCNTRLHRNRARDNSCNDCPNR